MSSLNSFGNSKSLVRSDSESKATATARATAQPIERARPPPALTSGEGNQFELSDEIAASNQSVASGVVRGGGGAGGGRGGGVSRGPTTSGASNQRALGETSAAAAGWRVGGSGGARDPRNHRVSLPHTEQHDDDDIFPAASNPDELTRRPNSSWSAREAPAALDTRRRPASSTGSGGLTTQRPSSSTSNTQRLSSIEILNENKQRQLQLEQQESFKQHLEQRQRFIQQQQQQAANDDDLDYSAYHIETSAPDYVRMANASQRSASGPAKQASKAGSVAVNPFDEEPPYPVPASDQTGSSTVSGRSGFLATLMGSDGAKETESTTMTTTTTATSAARDSKQQQQQQQVAAAAQDESDDSVEGRLHGTAGTRYSKVAASGACSYNYAGGAGASGGDDLPFYRKDIGTLLIECRNSRKLVILIVAVALLLDNMLLTAVVPIIPAYLYKLRVVREHRNLLTSNANNRTMGGGGGKAMSGKIGPLDRNRDGRVDEDEIEAELARRINQSLASAQDRFSGSFFHPRVLKPRDKFGNVIDNDNDDDDDDAGQDRDRNGRRRSGRRGDDDDEDDDDEDDDDHQSDGARSGQRSRGRKRFPRGESSTNRPLKKLNAINIDDEYEANGDDDGDGANGDAASGDQKPTGATGMNGKMDTERAASLKNGGGGEQSMKLAQQVARSPVSAKPSRAIAANKPDGKAEGRSRDDRADRDDRNDQDDGDDDDEDAMATRKWNKLRTSLKEMAQSGGNDTDSLGDMCLSLVLDRPNYFNRRMNDDTDARQRNSRPRGRSMMRVRDGDDDDNEDGDEDDRNRAEDQNGERDRQTKTRQRSSRRNQEAARTRQKSRPSVERLRPVSPPPPTQQQQGKDAEREKEMGRNELEPDAKLGDTGKTIIGDDEVIINHQDIVDESFEVGVMFASKPIVQAIANPFVGAITNRVGFTLPMFLGFTIMFLSTLVFAFGETYATLFLARAIQGVGSACTSVAGMSMIADRFPDDAERGNAMAVALGGLALGVVIGPPFGGFMYEFFGKPSPFIVLAMLALLDGLLQLLVLQPRVSKSQDEGASLLTLIKDPYILVAAGAITFANTGIGILEPALPLWMMDTMQAKNWEQGVAFLPAALSYLFSTNLFGNLGLRIGRWRSAMLGLVIIGCSLLLIPFASRVDHLILPNGAIGFAIGMVDSTMMPMLGYLVDIRHTSVYGSVYAIGDVAFCASFVFGPALSGTLVELIGFEGLIITTALICFAFAPLLVLLRDPPVRQVNEAQMQEQSTLRYVNYNHLDSPDEEAQLTGKTSKSYVR